MPRYYGLRRVCIFILIERSIPNSSASHPFEVVQQLVFYFDSPIVCVNSESGSDYRANSWTLSDVGSEAGTDEKFSLSFCCPFRNAARMVLVVTNFYLAIWAGCGSLMNFCSFFSCSFYVAYFEQLQRQDVLAHSVVYNSQILAR